MPTEFSYRTRNEAITKLKDATVDALIIGGGITGSGVASILAESGINVVLVEKGDFASGTSSGSSKLIHGGLRYLQQGRIREVRNLIRERNYLRKNTEIVGDMEFHILIGKKSWSRATIRSGLFLYNILDGRFQIPRFRKNSGIYGHETEGYFTYMDAYTDDSRLVISNICSAHAQGGVCLNYCEVLGVSKINGFYDVTVADNYSRSTFSFQARAIVNCAGPWAEKVMRMLGSTRVPSFRLSKGIHIVLPSSLFGIRNAVVFRSPLDGRQLFIIPRGEVVHLGTTDNYVQEPDDFSITDEEITYLIQSASSVFRNINRSCIIAAFSGIRPLVSGSSNPGTASRESLIIQEGSIVNVLGGKLTDYRTTSRDAARRVIALLGLERNINDLPRISYHREGKPNDFIYDIRYECALTAEDILRRREGLRIYSLDGGKSLEDKVYADLAAEGLKG